MVAKVGLLSIANLDTVTFDELACMAGRLGAITALLDAARLPGLPDRIKSCGVTVANLFDGEVTRKPGNVAPCLISLNGELSHFHALLGAPIGKQATPQQMQGILLLSDLGLNPLCRHFRRFLHIEAEGRTCLFRFWDPATAIAYFDAIAQADDRWRWFAPCDGGRIEAILVPDGGPDRLRAYRPGPAPAESARKAQPFRLEKVEAAAWGATRSQVGDDQLVAQLRTAFPQLAAQIGRSAFDGLIRQAIRRCAGFGLTERAHVFRIAAWDLHARGRFEDVDPGNELARILAADLDGAEKIRRLAVRIATLAPANSQLPSD